jgi:hypothetical protein
VKDERASDRVNFILHPSAFILAFDTLSAALLRSSRSIGTPL